MKKIELFIILLIFSAKGFSQDFASMFSTTLIGKDISSFHSLNKNTKQSTLFLVDKNKVYACRLDLQMQLKDTFSYKKPTNAYINIIGGIETQDKSLICWSTKDFSNLLIQSFNFKERKVDYKPISFDSSTEKIIRFFSEKQHFYILSLMPNSNEIKLTIIDENNVITEQNINVTQLNLNTINQLKGFKLVVEEQDTEDTFEHTKSEVLQKIESNEYVFYTESSKKNKCYSNENTITITLDSSNDFTTVITIDLSTFLISEKQISKTYLNSDKNEPFNSNSFLIDEKLFQVCFNSKDIIISIRDLNNNLIKEYSSLTTDFNEVQYITEKEIGVNKIIPKKEKFLSSLNKETGISCYKVNDSYQISFGSPNTLILSEEKRNNNNNYTQMFGLAGGLFGALIGSLVDYSNSSKQNFTSFINNGRSYFNFTVNDTFNHINNRHYQIAAEKLRYFLKDSDPGIGQVFFTIDNVNYFGYYNSSEKRYFIRKFMD